MPRHRYDLLALDLDGTLYGPDGRVSPANAAAVRAAREAGIEVVICTGRGIAESKTAIAATDSHIPARGRQIAPIVVAGGAMVADAASGRTLHRWPMNAGLVRRLCDHFARRGRAPLILKDRDAAGFDYLVVNSGPLEPPIQWWFSVMNVEVKFVDHVDQDQHPEHTVRVAFAAVTPVMLELAASVSAEFGHETMLQHFAAVTGVKQRAEERAARKRAVHAGVTMPRDAKLEADLSSDDSGPHGVKDENVQLLEVFDRQVSKWSAIRRLAAEQGIAPERIAAVGDEVNDVALIEGVSMGGGLGIAMGNAVPAVKKAAKRETKSYAEDGVAHAIDRILSGEW